MPYAFITNHFMRRLPGVVAGALAAALCAIDPAAAQGIPLSEAAAPVPFGPGERAVYRVSFGLLRDVGEAIAEVVGIDTLRGHPTYHLRFRLKGGIPLAHVNNDESSWLDVCDLYSHRFYQNKKEVRYRRLRTLDFFPEQQLYHWLERDRNEPLASSQPLDDISFIYWARTLNLPVGITRTFDRYFKQDGNPVIIHVVRRDSVRVPAGSFRTLVLRPTIRTSGLFKEGGEAELHFSDDEMRLLVSMTAKVSIGTFKLELKEYAAGQRLSGQPFVPRT